MLACVLLIAIATPRLAVGEPIDSVTARAARTAPPLPPAVPDGWTSMDARLVPSDTPSSRPRAIEYSDWYDRRLTVHRIGSYTMLPLFAAEYALGQNLLNDSDPGQWMRTTHKGVALGIGALFTVNTITGAWNWWDSRQDPSGRTRRTLHTVLMLASDAGFTWAGVLGNRARNHFDARQPHRNVALGSIGIATIGTAMMWLWKD